MKFFETLKTFRLELIIQIIWVILVAVVFIYAQRLFYVSLLFYVLFLLLFGLSLPAISIGYKTRKKNEKIFQSGIKAGIITGFSVTILDIVGAIIPWLLILIGSIFRPLIGEQSFLELAKIAYAPAIYTLHILSFSLILFPVFFCFGFLFGCIGSFIKR